MTEKEEFNLGTLEREKKKIHSSVFFLTYGKKRFWSENDKSKFGGRRKKWKEKKNLELPR